MRQLPNEKLPSLKVCGFPPCIAAFPRLASHVFDIHSRPRSSRQLPGEKFPPLPFRSFLVQWGDRFFFLNVDGEVAIRHGDENAPAMKQFAEQKFLGELSFNPFL